MTQKKPEKKIVPRGKNVLVLVDPEETRESEHGVIIPDEVEQERKAQGTVESVGPDIEDIKAGDRVIYGAFAGESIKARKGGKQVDYKLLTDDDVIAFIK